MVRQHTEFNPDASHRARMASDALNFGYQMAEWTKFALGAVVAAILIWQERPAVTPLPESGRSDR